MFVRMSRLARLSLPPQMLLDGGMGTELISRGLRPGVDCAEAWNVDRPGDVREVHAAYFAAGADAVQTNTFGATRVRLRAFRRDREVRSTTLRGRCSRARCVRRASS
jgi:5-methyltetrahydrofolate--homocysteine methyltransferase